MPSMRTAPATEGTRKGRAARIPAVNPESTWSSVSSRIAASS